ncbi:molybdopterin biosynthesis protein [Helicovermis profundi]|uniref:Molybdopterin molybdenumtransferase n=1 Tax=Helicovermis profundi TaxID=3065157 RepID=A0AAU9ECR0_9FIRM|nr:molybdopterin biosynthesis protein [Clostridia bacterium S502]
MKKNKRDYYLSNIPLEKALSLIENSFKDFFGNEEVEKVKVIDSYNRIVAKSVIAKISSPHYNSSAVDGIAVKSIKTITANERNPIKLLKNEDYIIVDTGDSITEPFNSVIMIEDIVEVDENTVEIRSASVPWQNIRPVGEDIVKSEMIIPSNHKVKPFDIGAMLAGGVIEIECYKVPSVGIIPTGTEIIEPTSTPKTDQIIETNSRMFENLVREYGGNPKRYKPVIDDYELIKDAILKANKENDIVVINAGSSAGTEDYTSQIIEDLGELIFHGVAIKPGKPAMVGKINNKPIVGVPGFPVSAYVVFDIFVKNIIDKMLQNNEKRSTVKAILSKKIFSSLKHDEYIRIKLGKVDNKLIATPLKRGAGVTMSLVKADGMFIIPKSKEVVEAGEKVDIRLFRDISDIENTIVSIGSHDILLDIVSDILAKKNSLVSLSSAHVGSLGGIMALRKGESHIATSHLLDFNTGIYNESYISKFLKNKKIYLIKAIKREQGLFVLKGNKDKITCVKDIIEKKLLFVNRQNGSGTRVLLDYILKKEKLNKNDIIGYDREMNTHMTVATAVLSGSAKVGMGIKSVANIMNLDFIPIASEDYDFIVSDDFYNSNNYKVFWNVISSDDFKEKLEKLGGYSLGEFRVKCIEVGEK